MSEGAPRAAGAGDSRVTARGWAGLAALPVTAVAAQQLLGSPLGSGGLSWPVAEPSASHAEG